MKRHPLPSLLLMVALSAALLVSTAKAQIAAEEKSSAEERFGPPQKIGFRVGAEISAARGACKNIVVMVAVPLECPEQEVQITGEDFSPEVGEVTYRTLQGGARQMLISIPFLKDGATARAIITTEVATRAIKPPERTDDLKVPAKIPAEIRAYINGSPYIEAKHQKIRSLSKEIVDGVDESATDWEKIEAIYDYVLEHIEYVEGPDKGALDALRDKQADCQGRSAVFIALCRALKFPARMVWVDGHCYPEFYLDNSAGEGTWYPCESAGSRAFGEMPLARTILQKGDNFRVPERKEKLRYASDYMIGVPVPGSGPPKVQYIRQQVVQ